MTRHLLSKYEKKREIRDEKVIRISNQCDRTISEPVRESWSLTNWMSRSKNWVTIWRFCGNICELHRKGKQTLQVKKTELTRTHPASIPDQDQSQTDYSNIPELLYWPAPCVPKATFYRLYINCAYFSPRGVSSQEYVLRCSKQMLHPQFWCGHL